MKPKTKIIDGSTVFLALLQKLGAEHETKNADPHAQSSILTIGKCVLWEGGPNYWLRIKTTEQTTDRRHWSLDFSHTRERIEDKLNWPTLFKIEYDRNGDHPSFCSYNISVAVNGPNHQIDGADLLLCRAISKVLDEWVAVGKTFSLNELPRSK